MDPVGSQIKSDRAEQKEKRQAAADADKLAKQAAADAAVTKAEEDKQKALLLEEIDKQKKRARYGGRGVPQMENLGEAQSGITKTLLGG